MCPMSLCEFIRGHINSRFATRTWYRPTVDTDVGKYWNQKCSDARKPSSKTNKSGNMSCNESSNRSCESSNRSLNESANRSTHRSNSRSHRSNTSA